MYYAIILTTIIFAYCIGFALGYGINTRDQESQVKPKRKTGFALHPEYIHRQGRPKKLLPEEMAKIDKEEIGIVDYKSPQQLKDEQDINKRQEEEEMSKSLAKHFPIETKEV